MIVGGIKFETSADLSGITADIKKITSAKHLIKIESPKIQLDTKPVELLDKKFTSIATKYDKLHQKVKTTTIKPKVDLSDIENLERKVDNLVNKTVTVKVDTEFANQQAQRIKQEIHYSVEVNFGKFINNLESKTTETNSLLSQITKNTKSTSENQKRTQKAVKSESSVSLGNFVKGQATESFFNSLKKSVKSTFDVDFNLVEKTLNKILPSTKQVAEELKRVAKELADKKGLTESVSKFSRNATEQVADSMMAGSGTPQQRRQKYKQAVTDNLKILQDDILSGVKSLTLDEVKTTVLKDISSFYGAIESIVENNALSLKAKSLSKPLAKKIGERKDRIQDERLGSVLERASDLSSQDVIPVKSTPKNTAKSFDNVLAVVTNELEELTLTVSGYTESIDAGIHIAKDFNRDFQNEKALGKKKAVGIKHPDTFTGDNEVDNQTGFNTLARVNLRGYSRDAEEMAAQAVAAMEKNTKIFVRLVGESGGGFVVEEAIQILNKLGYGDRVKGAGFGTPDFIGKASKSKNYNAFIGVNDEEYVGSALPTYDKVGLLESGNAGKNAKVNQSLKGLGGHTIEFYKELEQFKKFMNDLDKTGTKQDRLLLSQLKEIRANFIRHAVDGSPDIMMDIFSELKRNKRISGDVHEPFEQFTKDFYEFLNDIGTEDEQGAYYNTLDSLDNISDLKSSIDKNINSESLDLNSFNDLDKQLTQVAIELKQYDLVASKITKDVITEARQQIDSIKESIPKVKNSDELKLIYAKNNFNKNKNSYNNLSGKSLISAIGQDKKEINDRLKQLNKLPSSEANNELKKELQSQQKALRIYQLGVKKGLNLDLDDILKNPTKQLNAIKKYKPKTDFTVDPWLDDLNQAVTTKVKQLINTETTKIKAKKGSKKYTQKTNAPENPFEASSQVSNDKLKVESIKVEQLILQELVAIRAELKTCCASKTKSNEKQSELATSGSAVKYVEVELLEQNKAVKASKNLLLGFSKAVVNGTADVLRFGYGVAKVAEQSTVGMLPGFGMAKRGMQIGVPLLGASVVAPELLPGIAGQLGAAGGTSQALLAPVIDSIASGVGSVIVANVPGFGAGALGAAGEGLTLAAGNAIAGLLPGVVAVGTGINIVNKSVNVLSSKIDDLTNNDGKAMLAGQNSAQFALSAGKQVKQLSQGKLERELSPQLIGAEIVVPLLAASKSAVLFSEALKDLTRTANLLKANAISKSKLKSLPPQQQIDYAVRSGAIATQGKRNADAAKLALSSSDRMSQKDNAKELRQAQSVFGKKIAQAKEILRRNKIDIDDIADIKNITANIEIIADKVEDLNTIDVSASPINNKDSGFFRLGVDRSNPRKSRQLETIKQSLKQSKIPEAIQYGKNLVDSVLDGIKSKSKNIYSVLSGTKNKPQSSNSEPRTITSNVNEALKDLWNSDELSRFKTLAMSRARIISSTIKRIGINGALKFGALAVAGIGAFKLITSGVRALSAAIKDLLFNNQRNIESFTKLNSLNLKFKAVGLGNNAGFRSAQEQGISIDAVGNQAGIVSSLRQQLGTQAGADIAKGITKGLKGQGVAGETLTGSLLAFSQIGSKGKLQGEEALQLKERLPNINQLNQSSLGMESADLERAQRAGEILAVEYLPLIAQELQNIGSAAKLPTEELTKAQNNIVALRGKLGKDTLMVSEQPLRMFNAIATQGTLLDGVVKGVSVSFIGLSALGVASLYKLAVTVPLVNAALIKMGDILFLNKAAMLKFGLVTAGVTAGLAVIGVMLSSTFKKSNSVQTIEDLTEKTKLLSKSLRGIKDAVPDKDLFGYDGSFLSGDLGDRFANKISFGGIERKRRNEETIGVGNLASESNKIFTNSVRSPENLKSMVDSIKASQAEMSAKKVELIDLRNANASQEAINAVNAGIGKLSLSIMGSKKEITGFISQYERIKEFATSNAFDELTQENKDVVTNLLADFSKQMPMFTALRDELSNKSAFVLKFELSQNSIEAAKLDLQSGLAKLDLAVAGNRSLGSAALGDRARLGLLKESVNDSVNAVGIQRQGLNNNLSDALQTQITSMTGKGLTELNNKELADSISKLAANSDSVSDDLKTAFEKSKQLKQNEIEVLGKRKEILDLEYKISSVAQRSSLAKNNIVATASLRGVNRDASQARIALYNKQIATNLNSSALSTANAAIDLRKSQGELQVISQQLNNVDRSLNSFDNITKSKIKAMIGKPTATFAQALSELSTKQLAEVRKAFTEDLNKDGIANEAFTQLEQGISLSEQSDTLRESGSRIKAQVAQSLRDAAKNYSDFMRSLSDNIEDAQAQINRINLKNSFATLKAELGDSLLGTTGTAKKFGDIMNTLVSGLEGIAEGELSLADEQRANSRSLRDLRSRYYEVVQALVPLNSSFDNLSTATDALVDNFKTSSKVMVASQQAMISAISNMMSATPAASSMPSLKVPSGNIPVRTSSILPPPPPVKISSGFDGNVNKDYLTAIKSINLGSGIGGNLPQTTNIEIDKLADLKQDKLNQDEKNRVARFKDVMRQLQTQSIETLTGLEERVYSLGYQSQDTDKAVRDLAERFSELKLHPVAKALREVNEAYDAQEKSIVTSDRTLRKEFGLQDLDLTGDRALDKAQIGSLMTGNIKEDDLIAQASDLAGLNKADKELVAGLVSDLKAGIISNDEFILDVLYGYGKNLEDLNKNRDLSLINVDSVGSRKLANDTFDFRDSMDKYQLGNYQSNRLGDGTSFGMGGENMDMELQLKTIDILKEQRDLITKINQAKADGLIKTVEEKDAYIEMVNEVTQSKLDMAKVTENPWLEHAKNGVKELSQALYGAITKGENAWEALGVAALNILANIAQQNALTAISNIGGEGKGGGGFWGQLAGAFISSLSDGYDGSFVPNYRSGKYDALSLGMGMQTALKKENHPQAFPAVINADEVVMSANGGMASDAAHIKRAMSNGDWARYKANYNNQTSSTVVPFYSSGNTNAATISSIASGNRQNTSNSTQNNITYNQITRVSNRSDRSTTTQKIRREKRDREKLT